MSTTLAMTVFIVAASAAAGLAGVFVGVPPEQVAITAGEMLALAAILREVLVPMVQRWPRWETFSVVTRRLIIAGLGAVAGVLENLATGHPPLLSVLVAVGGIGGAFLAHDGARKHEQRKADSGTETAPPSTGATEKPVGAPPPSPADEAP